jgi:transcriptional repressor NrdR
MKCPYCGTLEDKVIDSRISKDGETIRRRRECLECQRRFTTHERIEDTLPAIVKKDSRREPFDRQKILAGLKRACEKRDISVVKLEETVDRIEKSLMERGIKEIPSSEIGEKVMQELHALDDVAYVRFASVYRSFTDITDFMKEVKAVLEKKDTA